MPPDPTIPENPISQGDSGLNPNMNPNDSDVVPQIPEVNPPIPDGDLP